MPRDTRRSAAARARRVHVVQLGGGDRGTIRGPLPLWFDDQGVTYIRTAVASRDADGTVIHQYRAVDPTVG